jgi:hypothetical protein
MNALALLCLGIMVGEDAASIDFVNDIEPILTRAGCNSGSCHGALAGKGGLKLSLRGYDPESDFYFLTRHALGRRVDVGQPDASLVLLKATKKLSHGGGRRLEPDSDDYRLMQQWVARGAMGPNNESPKLVDIFVEPKNITTKVGADHVLKVKARYSDGQVRDVTRWSLFTTTNDGVVGVDESGKVTVVGPSETAINVWFGNRVASAIVTVPFDNPDVDKSLATSPRHNFIDEAIVKKLTDLRVPPSPQCNDYEFIRRVFLDCLGTLPTPDEVDAFVNDAAADKRTKLAAELLRRPEFVDYWTYKWCDLFLLSSRQLSQPAVWSFYRYLRQQVASNTPWDRLARDILMARGSNLQNGAANYFVMHKDPAELTETTAVTFLGQSLTCARCHNHPLEKWTQDQYWSFANLFGRVVLKSGDRGGEVVVVDAPSGDITHLRRSVPMPPTPLDAAPVDDANRRAALANWLTAPDNPFFAKAIVNRVWKNFFGRGLVEAEDDLRQTNPATHPELLDELAKQFIRHNYDLHWLIRTITASAAYQRSSLPMPGNEKDDRFYARAQLRRLPAEVILDAYTQITGVSTNFNEIYTTNMVPTRTELYPLGTRAQQLPDALVVSRFLDSFGRPPREQACACERQNESSTGQALHLNNGQSLNEKLRSKNSVAERWVGEKLGDDELIRRVFALGLSRPPTDAERSRFRTLLQDYGTDRRAAIEDLCWAVLTSREFLFNH